MEKNFQGCVGSGGRGENNPIPRAGIGLDLGFLQNPKIPTELSLEFIQKIPDREFLSQQQENLE